MRLTAEQAALAASAVPLVTKVYHRSAAGAADWVRDRLWDRAVDALLSAAVRYDPGRGCEFALYAARGVRAALHFRRRMYEARGPDERGRAYRAAARRGLLRPEAVPDPNRLTAADRAAAAVAELAGKAPAAVAAARGDCPNGRKRGVYQIRTLVLGWTHQEAKRPALRGGLGRSAGGPAALLG